MATAAVGFTAKEKPAEMDVDRLIMEVKKRDPLYNTSSRKYAERDMKEILWREVAQAVKRPVDDCKKKWKCVRDGFVKEVKNQKKQPNTGGNKHKKYLYYDLLTFLLPHMKNRDSICEESDTEEANDINNDSSSALSNEDVSCPIISPLCELESIDSISMEGSSDITTKKRGKGEFEDRLLHLLEKRSRRDSPEEADEDELYFRSILPSFRALPPQVKASLKLKFSQMIYDAQYGMGSIFHMPKYVNGESKVVLPD